jgi:hypothetical protein
MRLLTAAQYTITSAATTSNNKKQHHITIATMADPNGFLDPPPAAVIVLLRLLLVPLFPTMPSLVVLKIMQEGKVLTEILMNGKQLWNL